MSPSSSRPTDATAIGRDLSGYLDQYGNISVEVTIGGGPGTKEDRQRLTGANASPASVARFLHILANDVDNVVRLTSRPGGVVDGSAMTVAEAKQRYSFARDPDEWHRQPVCACGDYICQHKDEAPHPCGFNDAGRGCRCYRYRYSRMGSGSNHWRDQGAAENAL